MNILGLPVGFDQMLVPGKMRQNPKFNLGIIRVHKDGPVPGYKDFADQASKLHAHRNVLEIGLRTADAPGGRDGLIKRLWILPSKPMHAPSPSA